MNNWDCLFGGTWLINLIEITHVANETKTGKQITSAKCHLETIKEI